MQQVKVKMIIQIQITLLKVHIFSNQIDLEATNSHSEKNSSNYFLISKMDLTLSNGSSNSKKIAQQMLLKTIPMIRINQKLKIVWTI